MPGVLIIETMAQVSAVLLFDGNGEAGKLAYFMGISNARFRRTVVPGDQLIVESEMLQLRHNACRVKAVAKIEDDIAVEAEMSFGLTDAPCQDGQILPRKSV
jgi:3-hydroxyacyl-[acyl-carrier-protein] dehydratase